MHSGEKIRASPLVSCREFRQGCGARPHTYNLALQAEEESCPFQVVIHAFVHTHKHTVEWFNGMHKRGHEAFAMRSAKCDGNSTVFALRSALCGASGVPCTRAFSFAVHALYDRGHTRHGGSIAMAPLDHAAAITHSARFPAGHAAGGAVHAMRCSERAALRRGHAVLPAGAARGRTEPMVHECRRAPGHEEDGIICR